MLFDVQKIYKPGQYYFRPRRMRQLVDYFGITHQTSILDAGGTPLNWSFINERPNLTLINVRGKDWTDGKTRMIVYDGLKFPFPPNSFDLCYSNSVIEHVGDQNRMALFAQQIRQAAPRYYVQTPNRYFPIEPHFLCLFIHWLPFRIARRLIRYFSVWGWVVGATQDQVDEALSGINLLTRGDMERLFPDAEIVIERFFGLPKSIIARKR